MQPSAQGIASLYMGNPGALQQKVQKEQQAKPGIPPDLKNLMALNIVTNEQDAAKRQEAMNALNRMAPAGQPPTVAQSIQEQAKQKLQAQMLQQMRQQQGLQALAQAQQAPQIPEGTPQPEQQPQAGIDQLPVEMALAGGGIVAFDEGDTVKKPEYETPFDRMNRENRERAQREEAERIEAIKAAGNEAGATTYGQQMRALGSFIDRLVPDPVQLIRRLVSDPTLEREVAKEAIKPTAAQDYRAASNKAEAAMAPQAAPVAAPEVKKSIADLVRPTAQPARVPQPPVAAPAPAMPVQTEYDKMLAARMGAKPEDARAAAAKAFEQAIGAPDTSQIDRLIAELEGRKTQLAAPKEGMAGLSEFLQQVAAAGPVRTSYEAAARGAAGTRALEKERQLQQFELTKQQIEAAQKKAETERGFKRDVFAAGQSEYERVFKDTMDALKESGLSEREKRQLASREAEGAKDRANRLAVASAPGATERIFARVQELRRLGRNQEADELLRFGGAGAAGVGSERNTIMARRQEIKELESMAKNEMGQFSEEDQKWAAQRIAQLARANASESGGSAIPDAAIDALRKNPSLAAQFDQKYGKGAAAQYLQK